ncbi:hypothetical protein C6W96_21790 [Streptomyces sp. CS149]|nr:hypothetical protein C6W96_21790 [Streptomyces sp. CS149]
MPGPGNRAARTQRLYALTALPHSAGQAVVVNVLALARRVPLPDVPPLLAVSTRALLRVHHALLGR